MKELKRTSLVEQVYDDIKGDIISGKWTVGAQLPSEAELAALYMVNKMTVRMALQRLNAQGILETRNGEGTFVKKFELSEYMDNISGVFTLSSFSKDVFRFRRAVEGACMELAVELASDEEISEVEDLQHVYEELIRKNISSGNPDWNVLAQADFNFHLRICELSRNELMVAAYRMAKYAIISYMVDFFKLRHSSYSMEPGFDYAAVTDHDKFLNSLRKRDFSIIESYFRE